MWKKTLLFAVMMVVNPLNAEQLVDNDYTPKNTAKTFTKPAQPLVVIDQAHNNFHTLDGRYKPFAKILESDGYRVAGNKNKFSEQSLKDVDILVIANAVNDSNKTNWDLPNYPAFSRQEVEAVYRWVKNGGALLLIADHMPWPKASEALAQIFGFQFNNGYVEVLGQPEQYFELSDASLHPHPIVKGNVKANSVNRIRGFMGQGFLIPPQAKPLMTFTKKAVSYMPAKSWQIGDETPVISATGWHQGATLEFHKGRLVVLGEAGMLTAQLGIEGEEQWKMGLNAKGAEQNERFVLNIMHWLSRLI